MAYVCKVASAPITRLLEQCVLDRRDHNAMFGKIQTPHTNCQHNGGCEKIWVCFAAAGPRHLTVIEPNMNSFAY